MESSIDRMNIPEVSVNDVVEVLSMLFIAAIEKGRDLRLIPTPFLWGPAGIGKTECIFQIAERIRRETGKRVTVQTVHLLLFSPVDLRGVPVADEHKKFTDWLKPRIFDMDPAEDAVNILFLDELSAAPQSVQAAAYQLTLDRRIGEHSLPENCIVIAAGNRTTDRSVAYKMPKALCNRLMHYCVKSDLASWKEWAVMNGIDARIVGYLSFDPSKLCITPDSSELAYPTPRSWSFLSRVLELTGGKDVSPFHDLISACIGTDTALAFEQWCTVYEGLPSVESIACGRCTSYPRRTDELYALISGLTRYVLDRGERIGTGELDNICAYAVRFPVDFAMSFFSDLNTDQKLAMKLMKCRPFNRWLTATQNSVG